MLVIEKNLKSMLTIIRKTCTKSFGEKLVANYSKATSFSFLCSSRVPVETPCSIISQTSLQFSRTKSKNSIPKKKESGTDTGESDKDFFDDVQDKYTKTIKVNTTSMRLDVILKAGLGLSRNKLDNIFYDSKIRVNGEKVAKKSMHIQSGDEVDVIKGYSIDNKDFLTVARVEILSAVAKEENITLKIRRCKSLTVENYEGSHRWKE